VPRKIGGRADAMIAIGSDRPRSESSHPPASVRSLWWCVNRSLFSTLV